MVTLISIGDVVQMKKKHPCGSSTWRVVRTGADIKLRCLGCDRLIMLDRQVFLSRVAKWISHAQEQEQS